jgi:hypothetical protein
MMLNSTGECFDCSSYGDLDPDLCKTTVKLKLSEAPLILADDFASTTLLLSFTNSSEYADRIIALNFSSIVELTVQGLTAEEFTWKLFLKRQKLLIALIFTKALSQASTVTIMPLTKVVLRSDVSGISELIFLNKSSSMPIKVVLPPNPAVMSSIKGMAGSTEGTSANFGIATAAICSSIVLFPGLVSPVMKLFRVFKMLSRLRLINIYFGVYLEIFLTVCNLLFSLGGDEIDKETIMAAPDSRGKLTTYKVTPVAVQSITVKVSLLIILFAVRIYREKIRTYAVKASTLTWGDGVINRIAEAARVTMIASLSLDVLFYASHSLLHLRWTSPMLPDNAKQSLWLSFVSIVFISGDIIALFLENQSCNFMILRKNFRMLRKVNAKLEKDESDTQQKKEGLDLNSDQSQNKRRLSLQ